MKRLAVISALIVVAFNCLSLAADQKAARPFVQNMIDAISVQQQQQLWGQQGVDAARVVNGTWQTQWQIQTVMGTVPYTSTETWRWDARQGIFYDGAGWMWKGKTAGNYLQVKTRLVSGADAMLTIQFQSNNEAVGSMSVSATKNLSPVYGQFRATRVR